VLVVSERCLGNTVLEGLEQEAREAKRGCGLIQNLRPVGVEKEGIALVGRLISWRWLA
jgi:hypothetical protein